MEITSDIDSSVDHLKGFLQKNPAQAAEIASNHYRKWKKLEIENAKLAEQNRQLKVDNKRLLRYCQKWATENIRLKYPQSHQTPSLSELLNSKKDVS